MRLGRRSLISLCMATSLALVVSTPAGADDCLGPGDPAVQALITAKDWTGALDLATRRTAAEPDSLEARLDVARVHVAHAATPLLKIDFAKAGVPVDAAGNPIEGTHPIEGQ